MNGTVKEWIAKAEGDFGIAKLALRADLSPNYDAVCFHAQQCVEKLLKAVLIHHSTVPPRVHDLVVLSERARNVCPTWVPAEKDLRFLTQCASLFRYPGETATRGKAETAMTICEGLRGELLAMLDDVQGRM